MTTRLDRAIGGLLGVAVGDALGVPAEFRHRQSLDREPIRSMVGFGTHGQPKGTWSDDTSLTLCTMEAMLDAGGLDLANVGRMFVRWRHEDKWTPHGRVFDIGGATAQAIDRLATGTPPTEAGGANERDNGNGSLMRILPVAVAFGQASDAELVQTVHDASALTHRHPRSMLGCGLYALVAARLLNGQPPADALSGAIDAVPALYDRPPFADELNHFERVWSGQLPSFSRDQIDGSGYVVHTLEASLWCMLAHDRFADATLTAVNLGDDTDTTAAVTGGLMGLVLGQRAIPAEWLGALARADELRDLTERFGQRFAAAAEG